MICIIKKNKTAKQEQKLEHYELEQVHMCVDDLVTLSRIKT